MTNAPKNFAEWRETLAKMARTVETGQRVLAVAERVQAALLATGVPARHCFPSVFDPNVASWRIGTYGIDDVQFMVDADEAGALQIRWMVCSGGKGSGVRLTPVTEPFELQAEVTDALRRMYPRSE